MSQDQKIWYFHESDENHGPCDLDEMRKRVEQGRIGPGTYVWRVGMENWEVAENVAEMRSFLASRKGPPKLPVQKISSAETVRMVRSEKHATKASAHHLPPKHLPKRKAKFQVAKEDASTFIHLNPDDVDDSTKLMKAGAVRSAKKEARRVESEEHGGKKRLSMRVAFLATAAAGAVVYFGTSLNNLSPLFFGSVNRVTSQIKNHVASSGVPSNIPPSAYLLLAAATQTEEQGTLEVLKTGKGGLKPSFYVAGNVPNDVRLVFNLYSANNSVHVQFPMNLVNGFFMTEPLHTTDGRDLPPGDYQAVLFEDEDQSAAGKAYISQMKMDVTRLPSSVKGEKKIQFVKKITLP